VETIFSWPGLGRATYEAVRGPDLPMLQGLFLLFSASVIVANLLADLLYGWLDPRVRSS
jgi:peptide/nickel transport system permease protein